MEALHANRLAEEELEAEEAEKTAEIIEESVENNIETEVRRGTMEKHDHEIPNEDGDLSSLAGATPNEFIHIMQEGVDEFQSIISYAEMRGTFDKQSDKVKGLIARLGQLSVAVENTLTEIEE